MVGVDGDFAGAFADGGEEAGAHVGGAVFGEGETEDVFWIGVGVF